ncbi:MAG: RNA 3'-terminal phosphate cyclase [bacterium]
MIFIDGSFGEGGGQILRSALSLAAVSGRSLKMENIRSRRSKPGLQPQHLSAVRSINKVVKGTATGAKRFSGDLEFEPGEVRPGRYSFEIGTAGSTALVFQTLLPVLSFGKDESVITIHGGTHNPGAPPVEYLSECFLPEVRKLGMDAEVELIRHGFYPRGGGALRAVVRPWRFSSPLRLEEETDWRGPDCEVLISNLPEHVADREQMELSERLGLDPASVHTRVLPGEVGPGNALLIRYESGDRTVLITGFGQPGKKAERVAREAAREAKNFVRTRVPVDPRLADQLLLPLALGQGGSFLTSEVTEHTRTHAEVIKSFLSVSVSFEMLAPQKYRVHVPGAGLIPANPPG